MLLATQRTMTRENRTRETMRTIHLSQYENDIVHKVCSSRSPEKIVFTYEELREIHDECLFAYEMKRTINNIEKWKKFTMEECEEKMETLINGLRASMVRNVNTVKENNFDMVKILRIFDGELICLDEGKELGEREYMYIPIRLYEWQMDEYIKKLTYGSLKSLNGRTPRKYLKLLENFRNEGALEFMQNETMQYVRKWFGSRIQFIKLLGVIKEFHNFKQDTHVGTLDDVSIGEIMNSSGGYQAWEKYYESLKKEKKEERKRKKIITDVLQELLTRVSTIAQEPSDIEIQPPTVNM